MHKLPWSSEEIQDPHNLFLDVWATSGFWAFLALVAALALALWNLLGPSALSKGDRQPDRPRKSSIMVSRETMAPATAEHSAGPAARPGWLTVCAGLGLVLVFLVGEFNPFQNDLLVRWLVLTAGWTTAVLMGQGLWRRVPLAAFAFGAAALAMVINLLATGGIGFQGVAVCLWLLIALGLNLRDDRPCSQLREIDSRLPGFALALLWSALAGSFGGAIIPYWRCEAALAKAEEALAHQPPQYDRAQAAYEFAEQADKFSPRPWLGDAYLQLMVWDSPRFPARRLEVEEDPRTRLDGHDAPSKPQRLDLAQRAAEITRKLLAKVGASLTPKETIALQGSIVEATRKASLLYPTNASLHARLAAASAEIQMYQDAADERRSAATGWHHSPPRQEAARSAP